MEQMKRASWNLQLCVTRSEMFLQICRMQYEHQYVISFFELSYNERTLKPTLISTQFCSIGPGLRSWLCSAKSILPKGKWAEQIMPLCSSRYNRATRVTLHTNNNKITIGYHNLGIFLRCLFTIRLHKNIVICQNVFQKCI